MKKISPLFALIFANSSFADMCVSWKQAYNKITEYVAVDRGYQSLAPVLTAGLEWDDEDEVYVLDFGKNFENHREYLFVSCSGRVCTTRDECL